jgi:hypothetical protein
LNRRKASLDNQPLCVDDLLDRRAIRAQLIARSHARIAAEAAELCMLLGDPVACLNEPLNSAGTA